MEKEERWENRDLVVIYRMYTPATFKERKNVLKCMMGEKLNDARAEGCCGRSMKWSGDALVKLIVLMMERDVAVENHRGEGELYEG